MIKIFVVAVALLLVAGVIINTQSNKSEEVDNIDLVVGSGNEVEVTPFSRDKVIDLSGKELTSVSSDIFAKTNTEELDLSNNNLEGSLPAEVRFLQNLKVLDLSNNTFTGVPAEIGQLKNLEVLNLSNNQVTGLPYELGNLSNLKVLNLKGNSYAKADLEVIKQSLPATTEILVD